VRRREEVARLPDVLDRERVEDVVGALVLGHEARDRVVVVGALRDRLLEDRRVRGETRDVAVVDHPLQGAGREEAATDVVVPRGLSELLQFDEWIRHLALRIPRRGRSYFPKSFFARVTTLSTVNPNVCMRTGPGADAPNRSIVTVSPRAPTQRDQPNDVPL